MLFDLQFDYLTIGIFPKVGSTMSLAVGQLIWARNSVGDILDMVTQALEVSVPQSFSGLVLTEA